MEALIEGSVARDGRRVAISANLIDAFNEEHIWAERYDRDLGDILTVQSDFTQAIAREVQAKLTPSERARLGNRHVVNADAYEQYLKGQYSAAKETEEGRRKALRYFEQAIEIDPNDALAYAGIAQQYAPLGYYGFVSPIESDNKTVWAATKALELDDALAEAHASPGRFTRFAVCFRLNLHRPWRKRTSVRLAGEGLPTARSLFVDDPGGSEA